MKRSVYAVALLAPLLLVFGLSAGGAKAQERFARIDPEAEKTIRAMSDFLAAQTSFTFEAEVLDETVYGGGDGDWDLPAEKISAVRHVSGTVQRPGSFLVAIDDPAGGRAVVFDGQTITVSDLGANAFVRKDFSGSIDEAIDLLRETYRSDPPLSDLLESNLYDTHMDGVSAASHLGLTRLRGQDVHHLAFASEGMDWQVWVADGDQPVPVLLQITRRAELYWPVYQAWFTDWSFGPAIEADTFAFEVPEGAIETQFVEEIGSAQ